MLLEEWMALTLSSIDRKVGERRLEQNNVRVSMILIHYMVREW